MNIIVFNLLDIMIIAHALDWLFTDHPIPNRKLSGFLHTICSPLNTLLSQIAQLTIRGRQVSPSALSIFVLGFLRISMSALA